MTSFKHLIRDDIRALTAYHVQPAHGGVKLDAMENPYGLSETLKGEVGALTAAAALNRYPDPTACDLKRRLREVMGISSEAGLLLGNGSDEIIQILALAVARPGATLLAPDPSFVMFRMIATFCGLKFVGVDLRANFALDEPAMLAAVRQHRPAVTFLAFPNNPTGNLFDENAIRRIIETSPGLVVVDEAYYAFASTSFLPELLRYPNLLLMRTVSKLGLAGLRLGLLAGPPEILDEMEKLRLPYNINVLTQRVAARVLQDYPTLQTQAARIRADRTRLIDALARIPGVQPFPSQANFVLFRVPGAAKVHEGLRQRDIWIKKLSGTHALLHECLRVTVGTPDENEIFLEALGQLVARG